jgi:hypothetical protein
MNKMELNISRDTVPIRSRRALILTDPAIFSQNQSSIKLPLLLPRTYCTILNCALYMAFRGTSGVAANDRRLPPITAFATYCYIVTYRNRHVNLR